MNIDDMMELYKANITSYPITMRDDGEYYIEARSSTDGFLLRICDMALYEEDDAECHGNYSLRDDGIWIFNFYINEGSNEEGILNCSGECDDRNHAIMILWQMRYKTAGYRTGRTDHRCVLDLGPLPDKF